MLTHAKLVSGAAYWQGILDASLVVTYEVAATNRLADSAKTGDWKTVLVLLENFKNILAAYQWRPGDSSWSSVLHWAARHGARSEIVKELLKRNGLRSLPDAEGRIPGQIAYETGHSHLLKILKPPEPPYPNHFEQLDLQLAEFVSERCTQLFPGMPPEAPKDWGRLLRCPPVGVLPEFPRQRVWFPIIPEGGFRITLHQGYLEVLSWNKMWEGSGEAHVITMGGVVPVDIGFI